MKKGGGHIFQLSLICTLKAIEVIKKVKKRKKDWVIELRQINTLCKSCLTWSTLNPSLRHFARIVRTMKMARTMDGNWMKRKVRAAHPMSSSWQLNIPDVLLSSSGTQFSGAVKFPKRVRLRVTVFGLYW